MVFCGFVAEYLSGRFTGRSAVHIDGVPDNDTVAGKEPGDQVLLPHRPANNVSCRAPAAAHPQPPYGAQECLWRSACETNGLNEKNYWYSGGCTCFGSPPLKCCRILS